MSDEAALFSAILAHPDEDTPRLAYADWLDEQGGESNVDRAEYIRLEIESARNPPERPVWGKYGKQKRAQELFAKHHREWFPELYGRKNILRGARGSPDMARGFPYKLQCLSPKLLDVGDRLMRLAPLTNLQFLNLTTAGARRLAESPWVWPVRKMGLAGGYGSSQPDWGTLADVTHFAELRELGLSFGWLDRAGAERIAATNPFPKLERFYFGPYSTDDAPAALFAGSAFAGLLALDLSGGGSAPSNTPMPGLKEICASPALASLTAFDMGWRPTPGLAALLIGSTFWHGLEELDLLRNNLTDADLAAFLDTPSKLRVLELDDNKITAKGAKRLAEHPALANITHLELSRNAIGDRGLASLVNSPHARNLQKLEVNSCGVGLAGITALAESPHMADLREMWLSSNDIDLKGARALCASPHLSGLTYLYLGSTTGTAKKELKARFGDVVSC